MMRTVVASGNDALNILFEAATANSQEDNSPNNASPQGAGTQQGGSNAKERVTPNSHGPSAPLKSSPRATHSVSLSETTYETLQIWEACRFVRMGWFTAREAVTLVDLWVLQQCRHSSYHPLTSRQILQQHVLSLSYID